MVMHTRQCIRMSTFLYAHAAVFCEVLAEVHPAGVCVPLHFTVFVCAPQHQCMH